MLWMDGMRMLNRINRSLLANFVELVDVLIKRPSMFKCVDAEYVARCYCPFI